MRGGGAEAIKEIGVGGPVGVGGKGLGKKLGLIEAAPVKTMGVERNRN